MFTLLSPAKPYVQYNFVLQDYLFGLLTSYTDTPAGVTLDEGQVYNPYFPDGVLAMAQQLYDGMLEYPDGFYSSSF